MEALWTRGPLSIREIHEALPTRRRPLAYTTIQTMVYRLEAKGAIRRVKKIGNAHIFEAAVSRGTAERRILDDLLGFFGGGQPIVAHLVETGQLTIDDLREAEQLLRRLREHGNSAPRGVREGKPRRQS